MILFDIKRGSSNDGPGLRTVFFFKGCPLRCAWCHNPESHKIAPELAVRRDKCRLCGLCAQLCERHEISDVHAFDRENCLACARCADACPSSALTLYGYEILPEAALEKALRDREFYRYSGGGITLSGGEPMLQSESATELSRLAHEAGISVCVETCGCADASDFEAISPYVDVFLYDVKLTPELYPRYTGVGSERIFANLRLLARLGKAIILRCPIIPGVNDREEHYAFLAGLARELDVREVNLMPYHPIGLNKYSALGRAADYANVDFLEKPSLEPVRARIEAEAGVRCVVK